MIERAKQTIIERLGISRLADSSDQTAAALDALLARFEELTDRVNGLSAQIERIEETRLTALETAQRIAMNTSWAASAPLQHQPKVSVVMATRNRAQLLPTAIASVEAQTYPNWELVVIDDGSEDETAELLQNLASADGRVVLRRTDGVGAATARNVGLEAATGEWVAFLDDDNVMNPGWLRAIVEHTGREPECIALFGAQLREDVRGGDVVPWLLFDSKPELERLRANNTIDLGVIAARRDHPELRFDDGLQQYIDWEMVVRVMEHTPLEPVPVLASTYTSSAPARITDLHDGESLAAMQRRLGG